MALTWVIQNNLSKSGSDNIINACKILGIPYLSISAIPFDPKPPQIEIEGLAVFYGATNFINTVHKSGKWKPAVFFDEEKFRISEYMKHWKMLNEAAKITTLKEFGVSDLDPDELFFVRPDKDLKEFAGEVIRFGLFSEWVERISFGDSLFDCPIIVAEPVGIADEWRLFVVDGEVVTGSHYRTYGLLTSYATIPPEVIVFTEEMTKIWSPADIFVLDVGKSGKDLYVIEANCVNSSGFYSSDVTKIVKSIAEYITKG